MKNPELSLRATAKEAHTFFKQRQFEDAKQAVEQPRNHLLLTDPGARTSRHEDSTLKKQRSQSPFASAIKVKRTQSDLGSETQEYFYIARKVLHKRSLS